MTENSLQITLKNNLLISVLTTRDLTGTYPPFRLVCGRENKATAEMQIKLMILSMQGDKN